MFSRRRLAVLGSLAVLALAPTTTAQAQGSLVLYCTVQEEWCRVMVTAFERETGLPVLVNTSFNVHEEPIVNTPAERIKVLRDAPHRLCRDGSRALRLPAGLMGCHTPFRRC